MYYLKIIIYLYFKKRDSIPKTSTFPSSIESRGDHKRYAKLHIFKYYLILITYLAKLIFLISKLTLSFTTLFQWNDNQIRPQKNIQEAVKIYPLPILLISWKTYHCHDIRMPCHYLISSNTSQCQGHNN